MMRKIPSEESAREIAIAGLGYIAADGDQMSRFLALTGLSPDDLREAAKSPAFLIGVLDFFMGHEPTLISFAESRQIDPQDVVDARQVLAGPQEAW